MALIMERWKTHEGVSPIAAAYPMKNVFYAESGRLTVLGGQSLEHEEDTRTKVHRAE
jgi:hypothetical protein